MEVSGRTEWDNKQSTNTQRRKKVILCQPCESDGDTVEAGAFCETCNEFICASCLKVHRKLTATKNHVIKLKDEMPKVKCKRTDPCSEFCAVHKAEIIKFYCEDHDSVACGDCMVLNHKACSVKLVSDVSVNYDTSQELEQIKKKIGTFQRDLSSHRNELENDLKAADKMKNRIIKEIKLFRQEINEYLDTAERGLLKEIDELIMKQVSKLKHVQKEVEAVETEMRKCEKKIHHASDKINDLFVAAKKSQENLKECQTSTEKLASKCGIEVLKFEKSKEIVKLLTNKCPIGEISEQKRGMPISDKKSLIDAQPKLSRCLTVTDANDRNACYISGMAVLSSDDLLLVDCRNTSLKILNVKENKITSTYKIDGEPWDITTIDSRTFAVTVTNGDILFINTANGISKSQSIKVRNNCRGIDYRDGVIAMTFAYPASVQLLDMKGAIMHQFDISSHITYSNYIVLNNDNKSMFVSHYCNNVLCEFTADGELKAKIADDKVKRPHGLVMTDDGTVIVCCENTSDKLIMVTPTTRKVLSLPVKGVLQPHTIALSDDQSRIFIYDYSDKQIKVFDIT